MTYLAGAVGAIVLLVVALQWQLYSQARRTVGTAAPELEGPMAEKLRLRGSLLLYFYSATCGPCKAMKPTIDRMAEHRDNVFAVDIRESPDLAKAFGILATPTTILVRGGRVEQVLLGANTRQKLETLIDAAM